MILYFRRLADGAIITRELDQAAGARARVSPPAGAELVEAEVALAALAELAAERDRRRADDAAGYAETRRAVHEELLGLGLSTAAAAALSGHRGPIEARGGRA